jgi:hypothetical protein
MTNAISLTEQAEYPTIARLADPAQTTVGYQQPELIREAVQCYREVQRLRALASQAAAPAPDAARAAHKPVESERKWVNEEAMAAVNEIRFALSKAPRDGRPISLFYTQMAKWADLIDRYQADRDALTAKLAEMERRAEIMERLLNKFRTMPVNAEMKYISDLQRATQLTLESFALAAASKETGK